MNIINKAKVLAAAGLFTFATAGTAFAADYVIDTEGAHASINFEVNHLGYSFVTGRFDVFNGEFSFDKSKPKEAKITVQIDTNSVNSNHAERDKHLRDAGFLDVAKFPKAIFQSTSVEVTGEKSANIKGNLTLLGETREITIATEYVGSGKDPWGGERAGFVGTTEFRMKDFGIQQDLGPSSQTVKLTLHIEGIKK